MSILRFTSLYFLYCCILAVIASVLFFVFPGLSLPAGRFWAMFIFLGGITYIAYVMVDLGVKKNSETGVMAIMGSIALKMLFSMAFVLIYSLKGNEMSIIFMASFFSLYFLFSFFEIYCLLRNLRHQNK